MQKRIPPKEFHFKLNVNHQPPKWVQEQVFYQIFPDRFAASQSESAIREAYCEYDPDAVIKTWGEPVGNHQNSGAREFFGGDLKGVEQKLEYLEQLGVTALYFNPIFPRQVTISTTPRIISRLILCSALTSILRHCAKKSAAKT